MAIDDGSNSLGIVASRNAEMNLRWSRAQLFIAFHSGLAVAVVPFALQKPPMTYHPLVLIFGCLVGFLVAAAWYVSIDRSGEWNAFWIARHVELEDRDQTPNAVRVFSHPDFQRLNTTGWTNQSVLRNMARGAAIFWGLLFLLLIVRVIV